MVREARIDKFGHVQPPRRSIPVRLLVVVTILLAISLGARQWLQQFIASIERYEPFVLTGLAAGPGTPPITQSLVLVIVDGLRSDVAREMPTLEHLRRQGTQARVRVSWPATQETGWTTILSGATPELSGATRLNASNGGWRPIAVDHLLRRARVTRHTTALAGHQRLQSLIPAGELSEGVYSTGATAGDDAGLVEKAIDILTTRQPDLMVVQLSHVETAGQAFGGDSGEYHRAARLADEQIGRLISAIDLRSTIMVITSARAHSDRGGYAGPDTVVATAPLIIAGPGVKPGDYGTIDQIDIAPTLAALMGLPVPAHSQGIIRFEMLDISPPQQAEKALGLADQQIGLSDAYLRAIGREGVSSEPAQTLNVARSAWEVGNFQGALEIARQSDEQARQEMAIGRAARISGERQARLRVAVGAGIVFFVGLAWVLSRDTFWLLGAGLLAWLGPLGNADALATILDVPAMRWSPAVVGTGLGLIAVFSAWGRGRWLVAAAALGAGWFFATREYSTFAPNAVASMDSFRSTMVQQTVVALLIGGSAVLALLRPNRHRLTTIARTSYWFVFLLLAGLALELAAGYWLHSFTITWYLPEANLAFWHVTALMHTIWVAGLGIFLPSVIAPASRLLRGRRRQPASSHIQTPEAKGIRL